MPLDAEKQYSLGQYEAETASRLSGKGRLLHGRWSSTTLPRANAHIGSCGPDATQKGKALLQATGQKFSPARVIGKVVLLTLLSFVTLSIYNGISSPSYANLPRRYIALEEKIKLSTRSGRGNVNNEKVFIAANIVDDGLIRGTWGTNLLSLVDLLGEDNVFVSIYENDSGNRTSQALQLLQQRLKCNSSVVTGDHVPLSSFPTVQLPNGEQRVQRLAYLAEIRNRLLRPLDPTFHDTESTGFQKATDVRFDRILFLNDVYYSPLDAVHLLFSTNADSGRAEYRAACALDFVQFIKLYDTFVVRDTEGYPVALQFFPWFTHRGSDISRNDVLALTDAVRVRSCWGGMAAFDAAAFQPQPSTGLSITQHNETQLSIKFRSDGELFWEAAECCLIFADMELQLGIPSPKEGAGVFVNPFIRTAYSSLTWRWLPFFTRYERGLEYLQTLVDLVKQPELNPRRTHEPGQMVDELVWKHSALAVPSTSFDIAKPHPHYRDTNCNKVQNGHFEVVHRPAPAGGFCGQRRLFVMKNDVEAANRQHGGKNWEKVSVPWQ